MASVTFHLLVMTLSWPSLDTGGAATQGVVVAPLLHLRLPLAEPSRVPLGPASPQRDEAASQVGPTEVPVPESIASTIFSSGEAAPEPPDPPSPSDTPTTPAPPPQHSAVDGYVLRQALSVPPIPLSDIHLPWPPGLTPTEPQRGVFSLFIDERGGVDRMVPDGPTLLPALEASARQVFMAARFSPGEVEGVPVKALIRIEVVFDARPAAVSGAVVVSRQNL